MRIVLALGDITEQQVDAVRTVHAIPRETIAETRFVLFSQDMYDQFERALANMAG